MNIPAIYQFLQSISIFQGVWLVGLAIGLAFLLLWVERARFVLPLWLGIPFLLSIVASWLLPPYIVINLAIVGIFSCMILYITARSVGGTADLPPLNLPVLFFQVLLAIFVVLILWGLAYQTEYLLLPSSAEVTWLVTSFFALGVFRFATTTRPLPLGMAIMLMVSAVGIWQIFELARPLAIATWAILVLLTTLVTSFLMQYQARQVKSDEDTRKAYDIASPHTTEHADAV